jgi:hypothetical protein
MIFERLFEAAVYSILAILARAQEKAGTKCADGGDSVPSAWTQSGLVTGSLDTSGNSVLRNFLFSNYRWKQ